MLQLAGDLLLYLCVNRNTKRNENTKIASLCNHFIAGKQEGMILKNIYLFEIGLFGFFYHIWLFMYLAGIRLKLTCGFLNVELK